MPLLSKMRLFCAIYTTLDQINAGRKTNILQTHRFFFASLRLCVQNLEKFLMVDKYALTMGKEKNGPLGCYYKPAGFVRGVFNEKHSKKRIFV